MLFLAILASNKAFCLPRYLKCIEDLDYPKEDIFLYVHTNNNNDNTEEILFDWVEKNEEKYGRFHFESDLNDIKNITLSNQWTNPHLNTSIKIHDRSLYLARKANCDYYFVSECDNFVAPQTLKVLIGENKPIIAPMLLPIPNPNYWYHSNFWYAMTSNGWYEDHPEYYKIRCFEKIGTFEVPLINSTYLMNLDETPNLWYVSYYTFSIDFMFFANNCKLLGYKQYICNKEKFGYMFHDPENKTAQKIEICLPYFQLQTNEVP